MIWFLRFVLDVYCFVWVLRVSYGKFLLVGLVFRSDLDVRTCEYLGLGLWSL